MTRKTKTALIAGCLLLTLTAVSALAAGGASDPLASLSYLTGTFTDAVDRRVEEKLDDMMQQMGWRMQQQGFSMEQYLKLIGQTEQQMRDMYRSEALNNVKTELVIDEIIKAENIEATDEDVNKLLESYTTAMNQTVEQLRESFSEEQLDFFKHRASMNKALDLLWDNAKVTDEDADAKPEAKAGDDEAAAPAEA